MAFHLSFPKSIAPPAHAEVQQQTKQQWSLQQKATMQRRASTSNVTEMLLMAIDQANERRRTRQLLLQEQQQQQQWMQLLQRQQNDATKPVAEKLIQLLANINAKPPGLDLVDASLGTYIDKPVMSPPGLDLVDASLTTHIANPVMSPQTPAYPARWGFPGKTISGMSYTFGDVEEERSSTNDDGDRDALESWGESESEKALNTDDQAKTTLMIRNVPVMYTQEMLMQEWGNDGSYDFLYLPRSGSRQLNLSYAFINFVSEAHAEEFKEKWQKKRLSRFSSKKALNISLAEVQGLEANIVHFRTKRGRQTCQPLVFITGQLVAMPSCAA